MRQTFLPFALPDVDGSELAEIQEVLESNWITTGPKTRQFEADFAAAVGARYAIAVSSCTAALHLALESIGIREGDVVLTSPYTFAATAEVIRYFKAVPAFVDVEPDSLNINPEKLEASVRKLKEDHDGSLKAVIPIHIAGHPARMDEIEDIAKANDLAVVEDAAHAFPASYKDRKIGASSNSSLPSFSCFSFYATKTLTTGEGGMITTGNEGCAERCRIMSLHGISSNAWNRYTAEGSWSYEIIAPGYKYNMSDIAAAMGLAQLRRADQMWQRRTRIAKRYHQAFSEVSALQVPTAGPDFSHAWQLYMLRLNSEHLRIDRNQFFRELTDRNIGCSVHFIPLHVHPFYRSKYGYKPEDFPIAYREYQREISLPIYSRMSDQDIQEVIDAVLDTAKKFHKRHHYATV